MKTHFIYKTHNSRKDILKLQFTYTPSTKLAAFIKSFSLPTDITIEKDIEIDRYLPIDFLALFKHKKIRKLIKLFLDGVLQELERPTYSHQFTLPLSNPPKDLSYWFKEVGVIVYGPYSLHYDYAQQYRQIQKHLALFGETQIPSIEHLYHIQESYFPADILSIGKALANLSPYLETQLNYLSLIHYLSLHSNKCTGECFKSPPQIQADLNVSQSTLDNWLNTLKYYRWISSDVGHSSKTLKIQNATTQSISLTPLFWCVFAGIEHNQYNNVIADMMKKWSSEPIAKRYITKNSIYSYQEHVAQIQHVLKLLQRSAKSKHPRIKFEAIKAITSLKYS